MTFLVTGAAGFIGSNLVEFLLGKGHLVVGLDNFITGKEENIRPYYTHPNFTFYTGDLRNYKDCLQACTNVTYVLHQGAMGSVPRSMKHPLMYMDHNVKGTANILQAAKESNVKRFIYASSSSVYGDSITLPKQEGFEGDPCSPYAMTKKVNEDQALLYTNTFGLPTIGLRYFNVFGPRQDYSSSYSAVIPKLIGALKKKETFYIHGDGSQSRDFTYIQNVLEANYLACFAPEEAFGKSFNIACGSAFTIKDVVNMIIELSGLQGTILHDEPREGDIPHSLACIDEAKTLLGYQPNWHFEKGLEKTVQWFLDH